MKIICEICNKEFFIKDSYLKHRNRRFCSAECRNKYFSNYKKIKNCLFCGKEFNDRKGGKRKYCSQKCFWESLKGKPTTNKEKIKKYCLFCGKGFEVLPSRTKKQYCSRECSCKSRIGVSRNVTCAGWNKGKKWSKEIIKKFSIAKINLYLNKENHPRWMGGKSFEPYSLDWTNTLKKEIRQRDNYTCQLCGCRQEDTTHLVHHINYNKKNCNPDNLITLCRSCHTKTNTNRDYWLQFFKGKQCKEVIILQ